MPVLAMQSLTLFSMIPYRFVLIGMLLFLGYRSATAQEHALYLGAKAQVTVGMYWENGLSLSYSPPWQHDQLYIGLDYVSSRWGSAFSSNALQQDNYLLSVSYAFLKASWFKPLTQLNFGWLYADYESEIFKDLPNTSVLLSTEVGMLIQINDFPLIATTSMGYNLLGVDGIQNTGTVYPLFFRFALLYHLNSIL